MSKWPMKLVGESISGKPPVRGTCTECQDPKTLDEVLFSIDCGDGGCVCAECAKLPQYAKRLK